MQDSGSDDEMATFKNNCVFQVHLNSDDISLHKKLCAAITYEILTFAIHKYNINLQTAHLQWLSDRGRRAVIL